MIPSIPNLIYCADGNKRFASIAIKAGFIYGARMPATVYFTPSFIDQDWKKARCEEHEKFISPDCELCALKRCELKPRYAERLAEYKPERATVLDWEWETQLSEVLDWAEGAAMYAKIVIIIPKVVGGIDLLSERLGAKMEIGGKKVHLGYSVDTGYGRTPVAFREFGEWPTHLLGGSPQEQKRLWLRSGMNIVSVDGNMHLKMATKYNAFFDPLKTTRRGYWPGLVDYDRTMWGDGSNKADAPYEAFARSCKNIILFWQGRLDDLKAEYQLSLFGLF